MNYDNRTLIEAVTLAAQKSGVSRYPLIDRGHMWGLFLNRASPYRGPELEELPGLSDEERDAIRTQLHSLVDGADTCRGEVTRRSAQPARRDLVRNTRYWTCFPQGSRS